MGIRENNNGVGVGGVWGTPPAALQEHQANVAARALYEGHGFQAVKFDLSPAPESAPDVEYHWRPE
jgi:hypothetical protein